ncbi:IS1634 family transposase [Allobaculum sp. JKK-2023]|uniref:IS1634 family transposase n=1 Tax=Allobaculum sp. JKK-2023 TaxID=3108943 RepID=UPI002B05E169|nr:IS1634 family transposase [Allobaculum sp. JKK-2023]
MSYRLKQSKSKNSVSFFIISDYTNPETKKRSTEVVEKLGNQTYWFKKLNTNDPSVVVAHLKKLAKEKDDQRKAPGSNLVNVVLDENKKIPMDAPIYNVGYLFPNKILHMLSIKGICEEIEAKYQFKFPLERIVSDLVCAQVVFPGSKRSVFREVKKFFDPITYSLDDIYRSLPILSSERYFIESKLYDQSSKICERDTTVLFYDCTNFYYETEDEDDFRKYGKSKENRPNPIVQYGLFMDSKGIPLADIVFDGNQNEQASLRTLEDKIDADFKDSKFIVCADAGLNGFENKIYNDRKKNRAYIVTQSIKKLRNNYKEWALKPDGWKLSGFKGEFSINNLKDTINIDGIKYETKRLTFYKEIWMETEKKSQLTGKKEKLTERIVVTYNTKYKKYNEFIREKKLERARKLIKQGKVKKSNNNRDPRYYISETSVTQEGEVADHEIYELDQARIDEEAQYDGFYCVATDLLYDDVNKILAANHSRWEIEESFMIMKSELESRPIYVSREEAIKGHLLICFIALLVYRILEQYLESMDSCFEIFKTLRQMNVHRLKNDYYVPSFERNVITDRLIDIFNYNVDREVITLQNLKKFLKNSKGKNVTQVRAQVKKAKSALN